MIFASVGSQLPFERLVRAVDEWAHANPEISVFVQIGEGSYEPRYAAFARSVEASEYNEYIRRCDLFIAHVGMGSILSGLKERKQMLMMPRSQALGEHTTDHQKHTASRFANRPGLLIVEEPSALKAAINTLLRNPLEMGAGISDAASPELISNVANFLNGVRLR